MRRSQTLICLVWLASSILVSLSGHLAYAGKGISAGMSLPQFDLNAPDSEEAAEYLELKNPESFRISQIPAKLVFIEIFSLYCPHCQRKAPTNNKIFRIIQADEDLKQNVRMIGIGAGNNPKETGAFKTKFRVIFPLFPDPNFEIHKKLGEPRTPFTILVTNRGKVLLTHHGDIKDIDEFVRKIKQFREDP